MARGHADLAETFANSYFSAAHDEEGRLMLPFYVAYRSMVRAKVRCIEAREAEIGAAQRASALQKAQGHFLLALGALVHPAQRPALILVGGLPGTGKSTVARHLAEKAGFEVVLRSDVIRKELAGVTEGGAAGDDWGKGIYTTEWTRRTYAECLQRAEKGLLEGARVIVDATFADESFRRDFIVLAKRLAVGVVSFECQASASCIRERLERRRGDASDADFRIYDRAREAWEEASPECQRVTVALDTEPGIDTSLDRALGALRERGLWAPPDGASSSIPPPPPYSGPLAHMGNPSDPKAQLLTVVADGEGWALIEDDAAAHVRRELESWLASGRVDLPVLPEASALLLAITRDEDCKVQDVVDVVQRDPTLAAHLLRISNSALFAPKYPASSLKNAVVRIGLGEVRKLAIVIACQTRVFSVPGWQDEVRELFKHSLATALYASEIAKLAGANEGEAFLCALLHDVGHAVLLQHLVDLQRAGKLNLERAALRQVADAYHPNVGGRLIEQWELSPRLAAIVTHHHDGTYPASTISASVRLADLFAYGSPGEMAVLAADPALAPLDFDADRFAKLFEQRKTTLALAGPSCSRARRTHLMRNARRFGKHEGALPPYEGRQERTRDGHDRIDDQRRDRRRVGEALRRDYQPDTCVSQRRRFGHRLAILGGRAAR